MEVLLHFICVFTIILVVLDARSRGMRPARTVSQAKEGEVLSTEALPRNQQLIPKIYNEERKEQS